VEAIHVSQQGDERLAPLVKLDRRSIGCMLPVQVSVDDLVQHVDSSDGASSDA
jgi:hypothetical protein